MPFRVRVWRQLGRRAAARCTSSSARFPSFEIRPWMISWPNAGLLLLCPCRGCCPDIAVFSLLKQCHHPKLLERAASIRPSAHPIHFAKGKWSLCCLVRPREWVECPRGAEDGKAHSKKSFSPCTGRGRTRPRGAYPEAWWAVRCCCCSVSVGLMRRPIPGFHSLLSVAEDVELAAPVNWMEAAAIVTSFRWGLEG